MFRRARGAHVLGGGVLDLLPLLLPLQRQVRVLRTQRPILLSGNLPAVKQIGAVRRDALMPSYKSA
eukprot:1696041-Rhodomonas_salina.1